MVIVHFFVLNVPGLIAAILPAGARDWHLGFHQIQKGWKQDASKPCGHGPVREQRHQLGGGNLHHNRWVCSCVCIIAGWFWWSCSFISLRQNVFLCIVFYVCTFVRMCVYLYLVSIISSSVYVDFSNVYEVSIYCAGGILYILKSLVWSSIMCLNKPIRDGSCKWPKTRIKQFISNSSLR